MKFPGTPPAWALLPLFHLLAGVAGHSHEAKDAVRPQHGGQWTVGSCRKLTGLLRQKAVVLSKLRGAVRAVQRDPGLTAEEKLFQVHMFEIFQKELNESESSVFQAVQGLQRALQGDYKDLGNVRDSSRQRLEALRQAAIQEETEYVELLAAERHQAALRSSQRRNRSLSMLDELLEDVRRAADRLEQEIEEHAFADNKEVKGVNFEAVLRVEEEEEEAGSRQNASRHEDGGLGLSLLIDSQNNQYILTRPRDATVPRADRHFIRDIAAICTLSLPCGWLCSAVGLPSMFGYVVCGLLLGPSGLNSIKSIVQVETLGEFGVFFTLFLVGLEFSPEKLRKVWKISLQGPCLMALLMTACGLLGGHLLHIKPTQSVFVSCCLSLSSTPLVSRFLAGSTRGDREGEADYSALLLGMLVVQDVQLGLLMAALPTLIQRPPGDPAPLGPAGADAAGAGGRGRDLSAAQGGASGPLLPEAARPGPGQPRDAGSRCCCLHLPHAHGHRSAARVHGAGLLPGGGPRVLTGTPAHRRGRGCRRAHPGLPGRHLLCVHRPPRVSHLRHLRTDGAAGPHAGRGGHEVCPGSPCPVPAPAEGQPVRQVDRGCGAGAGVPPHPECDHAQPAAGPGAVAGGPGQVCTTARTQVQPLTWPAGGSAPGWGAPGQVGWLGRLLDAGCGASSPWPRGPVLT
ncbi:transmembrane and coiled-coil domain-containing protein 3 isoform X2 [Erinaceus europaeus]|uniref:Transmembrane and coiled-coil domain-containing protein 3 isoform X2 n=1 Tax=Erinaceus europaeus TaxID=9365 RepID=A0ABM3WT46_ERIEU|nr:transmembrane and coiled-coil domain-containing protein 3 isoform X2 [Erinaceus europaeus]